MILLSHGYFLEDDPKEQEIMKPYVPLGILYISAFLESRGVKHNEVDDSLVFENSWASRTDREYDFKRKYSKQFYLHAVNWVYNEVNYAKTDNLMKRQSLKPDRWLLRRRCY